MQGTIIKCTRLRSHGKKLEYFLLKSYQDKSYSIAVFSNADETSSYAVAAGLTDYSEVADDLFLRVVEGSVRPETLQEILDDLIT